MARPRKIKITEEQKSVLTGTDNTRRIQYLPWLDEIIEATKVGWTKILLLGGTRSGKSYQLIIFCCAICLFPEHFLSKENLQNLKNENRKGLMLVVAREKLVDMDKTLRNDFQKVLTLMGYYPQTGNENDFIKINLQRNFIEFKNNGSKIYFSSSDRASSVMGAAPDICWFNEISEINEDFYKQLNMRTKMFCLFDCNPKMTSNHWGRKLLQGEGTEVYVHRSTWRDNTFLEKRIINEILSYDPSNPENVRNGTADEYYWKVYGLGQFAIREGVVFPEESKEHPNGWCVVDKFPEECSWVWALDVGFHDEMAFCRVGILRNCIYVDLLVYEKELSIVTPVDAPTRDSLIKRFPQLGVKLRDTIIYDAASASTGDSLAACGYNPIPSKKSGNERSIVPQIQMISRYKICVTKNSTFLQNELLEYSWKNKNYGDENPVAGSKKDHALDAMRYGAIYLMRENGDYYRGYHGGVRAIKAVARGVQYRGFI